MTRRLALLLLFLFIGAALLFVPWPIAASHATNVIENAGHMPLFFIGTLLIMGILRHDHGFEGGRLYGVAGLVGVVAAVASEAIQMPLQRDASWGDVAADVVGVLLALAVYALFDRRAPLRGAARVGAVIFIVCCLAFYLAPVIRMVEAYVHRNGQFPVLASFDSPIDLRWTVGYGVRREIRDDALEIEFQSERGFPGVSFFEPVSDWSGYRVLRVEVENPAGEGLTLGIRVNDRRRGRVYSDRFNRNFELAAGERRTLEIPLEDVRRAPRNRLMNMTQISDVTLFRAEKAGSRRVRLYSMRLQ